MADEEGLRGGSVAIESTLGVLERVEEGLGDGSVAEDLRKGAVPMTRVPDSKGWSAD